MIPGVTVQSLAPPTFTSPPPPDAGAWRGTDRGSPDSGFERLLNSLPDSQSAPAPADDRAPPPASAGEPPSTRDGSGSPSAADPRQDNSDPTPPQDTPNIGAAPTQKATNSAPTKDKGKSNAETDGTDGTAEIVANPSLTVPVPLAGPAATPTSPANAVPGVAAVNANGTAIPVGSAATMAALSATTPTTQTAPGPTATGAAAGDPASPATPPLPGSQGGSGAPSNPAAPGASAAATSVSPAAPSVPAGLATATTAKDSKSPAAAASSQGATAASSGPGDAKLDGTPGTAQPIDPAGADKSGNAARGPNGPQSAPASLLTAAGPDRIVPLAQSPGNNPASAAEAPSGQATTQGPSTPAAPAGVAAESNADPTAAPTAPHQHDVHDGELGPQSGPSDIRAADMPPAAAAGHNGMGADPTQSSGLAASANLPGSTNAATTAPGNTATANSPALVPVSGLAVEIAARAHDGTNRFEIRLDPPELGRIDVHLHLDRDGTVTSHLVVDRSDTLNLLRRDAPSLERALQTAGLKTGEQALQFSLRDQPREQALPNAPAATRVIIPDEVQPLAATTSVYARRLGIGAGIDIRV